MLIKGVMVIMNDVGIFLHKSNTIILLHNLSYSINIRSSISRDQGKRTVNNGCNEPGTHGMHASGMHTDD